MVRKVTIGLTQVGPAQAGVMCGRAQFGLPKSPLIIIAISLLIVTRFEDVSVFTGDSDTNGKSTRVLMAKDHR